MRCFQKRDQVRVPHRIVGAVKRECLVWLFQRGTPVGWRRRQYGRPRPRLGMRLYDGEAGM